jgi:hypothetical protein
MVSNSALNFDSNRSLVEALFLWQRATNKMSHKPSTMCGTKIDEGSDS